MSEKTSKLEKFLPSKLSLLEMKPIMGGASTCGRTSTTTTGADKDVADSSDSDGD